MIYMEFTVSPLGDACPMVTSNQIRFGAGCACGGYYSATEPILATAELVIKYEAARIWALSGNSTAASVRPKGHQKTTELINFQISHRVLKMVRPCMNVLKMDFVSKHSAAEAISASLPGAGICHSCAAL